MGIRPEFRWWILTLVIVGILVLISALALDRRDVVWEEERPLCPHCRTEVGYFSERCRSCRQTYDWTPSPEPDSPVCHWGLSTYEARYLRDRVAALGRDEAARRVAEVLGVATERARDYLDHADRGRCGWCGGTGAEPSAAEAIPEPCPVCLGRGTCVGCAGDRRVTLGDEGARIALARYETSLGELAGGYVDVPTRRAEARRLAQEFLSRHPGTREAQRIRFWPSYDLGVPATPRWTAVGNARSRLSRVLEALRGE